MAKAYVVPEESPVQTKPFLKVSVFPLITPAESVTLRLTVPFAAVLDLGT